MSSSCTGCLDGSSPWGGCQRCLPDMGRSPHNPRASFYRTIDVLLAHGLRPSSQLLKHLQKVRLRRVSMCIRLPCSCSVAPPAPRLLDPPSASRAQLPTAPGSWLWLWCAAQDSSARRGCRRQDPLGLRPHPCRAPGPTLTKCGRRPTSCWRTCSVSLPPASAASRWTHWPGWPGRRHSARCASGPCCCCCCCWGLGHACWTPLPVLPMVMCCCQAQTLRPELRGGVASC
jgi:hypothetical protein